MKSNNSENGNLSFFTQYGSRRIKTFHTFIILHWFLNLKSLECNVGGEDLLTFKKWNFRKTFQGVFWMKLLTWRTHYFKCVLYLSKCIIKRWPFYFSLYCSSLDSANKTKGFPPCLRWTLKAIHLENHMQKWFCQYFLFGSS